MAAEVEFRCFIGGLAWATDDQSLERAFAQFSEVIESKIINDRETRKSRGFGFVTFIWPFFDPFSLPSFFSSLSHAVHGVAGERPDDPRSSRIALLCRPPSSMLEWLVNASADLLFALFCLDSPKLGTQVAQRSNLMP
ncbi:cold, circadian rhythm, and RNA binding 1 [Actinidia rufa]|uniref:Cold, circadian rhythm, and RNA binding 1 n=1 Tax=Actinidia rufa TaxID=165716 RepID=A0A7J0DTH9_9ERIC|nr:cold, circadian rhythm, and RNA binding 1 [Actinidia rufa]